MKKKTTTTIEAPLKHTLAITYPEKKMNHSLIASTEKVD